MKFIILFLTITTLVQICAYSQTVEELYKDKDFQALIKFAGKSEELSKNQIYCVGYAFFQLENDKKAIEMNN